MSSLQFRVLFRHFLFRMPDPELLSAEGDMSTLFGQFAALLIFMGIGFSGSLMGLDTHLPKEAVLISAWGAEHSLISATMLVVGLFAVLSWDATFPDHRDVLVLGPLPVRAHTLFLARVAASAAALSLTVIALNALTGLAFPLALLPPISSFLDLITSLAPYRQFAAFWVTMMASGAFIYCSVLTVQGLAAQLLPRRLFLRFSAFFQIAAFCLFITVYFLEPSFTTPRALGAPENQRILAWLPSYWFLGLFQDLNGSMHPSLAPQAKRAWIGLCVITLGTFVAYAMAYLRTLRRIVEEPDIVPSATGLHGLPRFGSSLTTAIVHFSFRTLRRSRQHRVMLAFYLGIGFAILMLMMNSPFARQNLRDTNSPLLFSSLVLMCVCVVGTRVVFAVPIALRANWIFRMTEVSETKHYLAGIRWPLFVLAVAPVWLASGVFFLSAWHWRPAVGHLVVLGLWGMVLAWVALHNFHKIPFTCSWLPGNRPFNLAFLGALGALFVIGKVAIFERRALEDPAAYAVLVAALFVLLLLTRWKTSADSKSEGVRVQFEESPPAAVLRLGLQRDGVLPGCE